MSLDLLSKIEQAEKAAEEIRLEAAKQAREMMKSTEEACMISEREAVKEIREEAQRLIDEVRVGTQDEIRTLEVRRSLQRENIREKAQGNLGKAGQAIFERIVSNGNR